MNIFAEKIFIYFYFLLISTLISFCMVPLCKKVAFKYKILDHPGIRKVHVEPKPLLGGLSLFISFNLILIGHYIIVQIPQVRQILYYFLPYVHDLIKGIILVRWQLIGLIIGGFIIFIIGLMDDLYGVNFSPAIKFSGQFLAATLVTLFGVRTDFFPGKVPYDLLNYVISILWIVGLTNSFNFLDNMDGLSSGIALITSGIFCFVAVSQEQVFVAIILSIFSGSILGFFKNNYHPSSIFLGDAGSLFLGFILSSLIILESFAISSKSFLFPVLMPVIVMSVPLFDTFSVIIIRLKLKKPIYIGDNNHLSHRLVNIGMEKKSAVEFIYLITFCLGITATLLNKLNNIGCLIIASQTIGIIAIISILMYIGGKKPQ